MPVFFSNKAKKRREEKGIEEKRKVAPPLSCLDDQLEIAAH